MDGGYTQQEYVRRVLDAYRVAPGTTGAVRRPDRLTASDLYRRGVPATVVENAFVLAATRRLCRPPGAMPLGTIRSLAYFLPVIDQILEGRISPDYFHHLRYRLRQAGAIR